jgi:hypothetical protein
MDQAGNGSNCISTDVLVFENARGRLTVAHLPNQTMTTKTLRLKNVNVIIDSKIEIQ